MDMINIGYSGASTAQVELNVTAQNTANAMTDGYTRQVAITSTIGASSGSSNSAGNGVQVDSIRRVSNQYQVNQVWYAASDYGYYNTQQEYLTQLETVLSDDNSSLSGGFDNFFAALNAATTSPDDSALREQVISESGALALRVDNTLDYIDSQSSEIVSQEQAMVAQVNTLTSGIAGYNQQIAEAEANGDNASALYDARDQMVEQLSGIMDVQVNIDDEGNYDVTLQNGQPLVSGQESSTIELDTNADGTQSMSLTFAGTTSSMNTETGGSLGALFDYQNKVLTPLTGTINSMAEQFADAVNTQLAQGYDLNGNPGEPLFIYDENSSDGPLEVNPDITADELAFSSSPDESGNSDNLQALINISTEPLDIEGLGSVTVGEACSSIISNIGIYSQQNQTEAEAAANVYSEAQNQQSSVSGVSMDEEAVNLITYQQIYEANLKVISTGADIFDSVLEMCS
ncbi:MULTISPECIES: flagellar hook-associated protein FlgK [Citrobacter freundii complex]|uniref:flagellar hook-associated protein FlgK n=1 Tax=Citrobacter freundii complex TaxID=1344959 RepID=UPI0009AE3692|nr:MULTISPECIES: flagellar hook-associated protein FlgK [Citrobacter freundii complex]MBA8418409.1 flagellar hook-associated protein FlgK [Citrobacter freundii]RNL68165.1 flagellar hook-associated protein FlgK [Citrobacter sp. MH181794]MBJ9836875.1 flagellar hook-associated protein FlgK [Citrobacter freundii]MDE9611671.1 flagellar hook-associated protein FlgK [Citrobacter portucalensis]OPW91556.1 flagellar hook-associated protein FlgK [Citrobacter sp. A316]